VLALGERTVRLNEPQIVGILNVTPDSFSDGGKHVDAAAATDAGFAMASAGAAIVDVGGESTRPGAPLVWEGDEIGRIEGVVAALAKGGVAVSIDTRKAAVMEAALAAGAGIVNDISALRYDDRAMEVVASAGCPVVLMHAPSAKSNPHEGARYDHVLLDVYDMLADRVAACRAAGIDPARIIVDPGIGFGKGVADNLALVGGLALFHTLGCPILFGASRKRMIGALDNEAAADQRLGGSVALHYQAAAHGAQLLRVHDVAETRQALRVWRGLRDAALTG
jgi:dihydropteroate synthase